MGDDCRNCIHNGYKGNRRAADWVDCYHPITVAKTPKWEKGDPAFVAYRTGDVHVRNLADVMTDGCPAWEKYEQPIEGTK